MNKKLFLSVMSIAIVLVVKAGDESLLCRPNTHIDLGSKYTLAFSVGAGLPMDAYGKASMLAVGDSTHRNGWAKTGFHFDVTMVDYLSANLGAMLYIGGNINPFDAAAYQAQNNIPSSATFSAKNYYLGQYFIGPFYSIQANYRLTIDIRLLAGLVTATMPSTTESTPAGSFTTSGNMGEGFGYQFGAGLHFNVTDKFGYTFNIAYTGSDISYSGYTVSSSDGSQHKYTTTQSMATGLVTATVGVAFGL